MILFSWSDLRVGDSICMVAMPCEFREPEYDVCEMSQETRDLYEHLIAKRAVLTVYEIDDWVAF